MEISIAGRLTTGWMPVKDLLIHLEGQAALPVYELAVLDVDEWVQIYSEKIPGGTDFVRTGQLDAVPQSGWVRVEDAQLAPYLQP